MKKLGCILKEDQKDDQKKPQKNNVFYTKKEKENIPCLCFKTKPKAKV